MDGGHISQDSTLSKGGAVIEPVPSKEVTTETETKANSTESSDAGVDECVNPYLYEYSSLRCY